MAAENDEPCDVILEEASVILDEMAQNLQLRSIRLLGFIFTKVFKSVFRSIYVNEEGLTRVSDVFRDSYFMTQSLRLGKRNPPRPLQLQQAIQDHPVILMPNHRSYVDFLVLSYIMFTYDLSVPVIAAGIRKYPHIFFAISNELYKTYDVYSREMKTSVVSVL